MDSYGERFSIEPNSAAGLHFLIVEGRAYPGIADEMKAGASAALKAAGATRELVRNDARLEKNGGTQWCSWLEPKVSSADFARAGDALESEPGAVTAVTIGRARCRAVRLGALVRFAEQWFSNERG